MTGRKEKTSLIQMLNTSIGNISGLFKGKKEDKEGEEIEIEEIVPSHEKQDESFLLKEEEEEFEKDLSRISISIGENVEVTIKEDENVEIKNTVRDDLSFTEETNRLRKIIILKDEIRQKEREKEKEREELNTLASIKIRAELDYERKRRKVLQQVILSLEKTLEESEIQKLELMKYCKLLIEQEQKNLAEKKDK